MFNPIDHVQNTKERIKLRRHCRGAIKANRKDIKKLEALAKADYLSIEERMELTKILANRYDNQAALHMLIEQSNNLIG